MLFMNFDLNTVISKHEKTHRNNINKLTILDINQLCLT